jgi:hypothetical protein
VSGEGVCFKESKISGLFRCAHQLSCLLCAVAESTRSCLYLAVCCTVCVQSALFVGSTLWEGQLGGVLCTNKG